LFGSRRNSAYVSDVDAEQDAIENKYNALREEVLPKAEMGTRRRLNEQEPLKPVRS
jgi:outer membrane murein-binding lipoprotein Lpp